LLIVTNTGARSAIELSAAEDDGSGSMEGKFSDHLGLEVVCPTHLESKP
jgi:hypothetical protein